MIKVSIKDETASSMASQVYDQLWSEQGLRTTTADIEIEAAAGAVTLNGRVRTQLLRRQAERLARAGLNGWRLHNNLIADDRLAMDLAALLAADPRTAAANVRFEVFLGVAYLGGTVNSSEQRAAALELAGQAPGVIKAEDRLTIAR
ncbi:MAG TPA: BON domain-containing protein [Anaerolineae bacterium]|nr:BON domain-containing protein [Anaerolineae bacterium]